MTGHRRPRVAAGASTARGAIAGRPPRAGPLFARSKEGSLDALLLQGVLPGLALAICLPGLELMLVGSDLLPHAILPHPHVVHSLHRLLEGPIGVLVGLPQGLFVLHGLLDRLARLLHRDRGVLQVLLEFPPLLFDRVDLFLPDPWGDIGVEVEVEGEEFVAVDPAIMVGVDLSRNTASYHQGAGFVAAVCGLMGWVGFSLYLRMDACTD